MPFGHARPHHPRHRRHRRARQRGRQPPSSTPAGGWPSPWVDPKELERVREREGLVLIEADLFDEQAVGRPSREAAGDRSAPLRAVANLVGGYAGGARVHETPSRTSSAQFTLNLRPTFLVTHAALPRLIDGGRRRIVCVSTRAAVQPFSGAAGYIASKAAVIAFAKAVAAEYRDDGVRCNAILPSVIDTPANRASQPDADHSRWVAPAEIAAGRAVPVLGRVGAGQRRRGPRLRARLSQRRRRTRMSRTSGR